MGKSVKQDNLPHCSCIVYRVTQKKSARLRELTIELGASSCNLADVCLDNPVQCMYFPSLEAKRPYKATYRAKQ